MVAIGRVGLLLALAALLGAAVYLGGVVAAGAPAEATTAPECPASVAGVPLVRGEIVIAGETKTLECRYSQPGTTRDPLPTQVGGTVYWLEPGSTNTLTCAKPEERIEIGGGFPRIYRYSQTKAATLQASGSGKGGALVPELADALMPAFRAAEALAIPCPSAAALQPTTRPGAAPSGEPSGRPGTASDAISQTIVDLLGKVPPREGVALPSERELAKEALDAIGSLGGDKQSIEAASVVYVAATLAVLERRDGRPAYPAIKAAMPVIAKLGEFAATDERDARALERFVTLLADLESKEED